MSTENQSLIRGMKIIEFLSEHPNGCSLADIADGAGLNKSTAYRLVKSLESLRYVTAAPGAGFYRLTSKFIAVGSKTYAALDIIHIAQPHLQQLNSDTGETVKLSAREGYRSVLMFLLHPTEGMFRTRSYIGQGHRLYCSGMGKCYLAFSPDTYLDEYWKNEREHIVRYTETTITDIAAMRAETARIRETRISYDREENELGISCVASPIIDLEGRVNHAISITLPTNRLTNGLREELGIRVKAAAEAISRELGWAGDGAGGSREPEE